MMYEKCMRLNVLTNTDVWSLKLSRTDPDEEVAPRRVRTTRHEPERREEPQCQSALVQFATRAIGSRVALTLLEHYEVQL